MRRVTHIGLLSLALAGAALAQTESETKLRVGQSAVQRGTQTVPRARLRFTLLAYVDPVHSRLYRPRKGTRFVAFKLRIANQLELGPDVATWALPRR